MNSFEDIIMLAQQSINKIDNIIKDEMENQATMCVADIQLVTPVDTGNLRRSITHEQVKKEGNQFVCNIGSAISYAPYVEEGYRTSNGGFVQGKHMIRDNVEIYQSDLINAIEGRIQREV